MGKVVKFTGSKLLGEELRRLRGGRTLDDVVELGKVKLAQYGFKSVAKGTLSEIENGITLPNIESVFALSILYQVPTSRFLHILLEENLVEDATAPADPAHLQQAFADAIEARRTTESLALAIHGLRSARGGWDALRWRLNRAIAIECLGMRWDAVAELLAAVDHPDLPSEQRYRVHRELARMHATAGQFSVAEMHLRQALEMAPETLSARERFGLLHSRIRLVVGRKQWGLAVSMSTVEAAQDWISQAFELASSASPAERIGLKLLRANLLAMDGDVRGARAMFSSALVDARSSSLVDREIEALMSLASLDAAKDTALTRKRLAAAAELAVAGNHVDLAFLAYFELQRLAESHDQAAHFLRKCRRLYPLIQSTHPSVRAFETMSGRETR